jgi:hypothetical protein
MTHDAKQAYKPHEIVLLIGKPDTQAPYENPEYPGVPTGAFVEYWACGCSVTPYSFGSTSLRWAQCPAHHDAYALEP